MTVAVAFVAGLSLCAFTGCSSMMHGQTHVHGGSDQATHVGTSISVPWGK